MLFCKLFWQKCSSGGCKSLKYPVQEGMVIGYLTWVKKHLVTHFPKNLILAWVYFFNFYLMPLLSFWHFSCCHFYLLKLNQQALKNETKFETHSKGRWHDSPASLYEVIANQMIDVHSEGKKSRNNSNNNATMICQWLLSYSWFFFVIMILVKAEIMTKSITLSMLPHKMWTDNMSSAEVLVTLIAQHGTRTGAKIFEPEINIYFENIKALEVFIHTSLFRIFLPCARRFLHTVRLRSLN